MRGDGFEMVVFADDWGRHPSSAQHLVRRLLPEHPTLWVNTVGTRRVRWAMGDVRRGVAKVGEWLGGRPQKGEGAVANLRVVSPAMYPGFRARWQRGLNARLVARGVDAALASPASGASPGRGSGRPPRVAVTTLPITADLVGRIDVDGWVYYCVDDFGVWPGLDSGVMQAMERELVAKVDAVVCVSEVLRERVRGMGREAELLTHGVDLEAFDTRRVAEAAGESGARSFIAEAEAREQPAERFAFWGLIDARVDAAWVRGLAEAAGSHASVFMAGPRQDPPAGLFDGGVVWCGEYPHGELVRLAAAHPVLVMPYVDAPVTRAMQPLKLLEYLATYKPVVVRDLPATRAWGDCCDVVSTAGDFVRVCLERAKTGLPAEQRAARERRLPGESWASKAVQLEGVLRRVLSGGR